MSDREYLKSLDKDATDRYLAKLDVLGLKETDDPYASWNEAKFVDEMRLWPPVEYSHIFCYFVDRPGVYTRKQLMQWKSMEAYNFFKNGHVRTVRSWRLSSGMTILKATINPSQRSPEKAHCAWVSVKSDGQIVTAHCTCKAGLGEGCSHVAAILFKVDAAVKNGYTSTTSTECQWNQLFTKKHEPSRIVDINFSHPKYHSPMQSRPHSSTPQLLSPSTLHEQSAFLLGLKQLYPSAAILSAMFPQPAGAPNVSMSKIPRQLPATLSSLFNSKYSRLSEAELMAECERVFKEIKVTEEEAEYLSKATQLQSESLLWFQHRRGRLTASKFLPLSRTKVESPSQSLIDDVLQNKPPPKTAALSWGIECEEVARKQYEELAKARHTSFMLQKTGLHVNPLYPHLGASPDGLVTCSCCGDGVLEIKCPYSLRHTAPDQSSGYLIPTIEGLKLSTTHRYFYQIQGQLAICNKMYCDFVCWTPKGIHLERISRVDEVFLSIKPKLDDLFVQVILPQILTGKMQVNKPGCSSSTSSDAVIASYCYCQRGEEGYMVACDNPLCLREWFHFECVGLTSPPEGSWFCPDCTTVCH